MLAGSWTTFCSGEFLTHFRIAQQPKHCRRHNRYHMRPDCAFSDPWSINWTPWCRLLARSLWHKVAVDRDMSLIWTSRRNFCVFKLVELFDYLNRMQALLRVIQIYFFPSHYMLSLISRENLILKYTGSQQWLWWISLAQIRLVTCYSREIRTWQTWHTRY